MFRELKIVSGSAHPTLARDIASHLGVGLTPTEIVQFSNENIMVQITENVRNADVFVVQPSCSPVSDGIIELLIMIDALKHASAGRITAVLPYFPYARSDKKDRPRISITARLMADLLESAGCDRVLAVDLHSPQVQGFFRIPTDQMTVIPLIADYLKERIEPSTSVLVAGDVGESKDVANYASRLDLPVAIVDKRRLGDSEQVKAVALIGSVEGKHAIIVDDEVASGGTMLEAAEFVMSHGALSVKVVAVHPILSGRAVQHLNESRVLDFVFTNTVPAPSTETLRDATFLSIAPVLAEAIQAIHRGSSVSELFR